MTSSRPSKRTLASTLEKGKRVVSREYADPNCPDCGGLGFIYGESMLDGGRSCHCMMDALKLQNMERMWKSLSAAREIPGLRERPPLKPLVGHNVWITSKDVVFRAHLKALAFSKSTMWDARVITDKDLPDAWLKTAKAQGHKIYQSEIENHDNQFMAMDIAELVEPPELLILKLGVMQTPNKELYSCVLETVTTRMHIGKPTWIIDQLDQRIDDMSHRAYSEKLESILSHWWHIGLAGVHVKVLSGPAVEEEPEMVSDMSPDDLLETEPEAETKIDNALSDLDEEEGAEGEDSAATTAAEEEEYEEEDEPDPMLAALMANEEKAAEKERYGSKKKKRSWGAKKGFRK